MTIDEMSEEEREMGGNTPRKRTWRQQVHASSEEDVTEDGHGSSDTDAS